VNWGLLKPPCFLSGDTAVFTDVQRQLNGAGLMAKGGQMIDATIVTAPKVHLDKEDKKRIARNDDRKLCDQSAIHSRN
jgi:hypothetical protein